MELGSQSITIIIEMEKAGEKFSSKIYIPEQMIFAHKISSTRIMGDTLVFQLSDFRAKYEGIINSEKDLFEGIWSQNKIETPLKLSFATDETRFDFSRPQEPVAPFPYVEQEIIVKNKKAKVELSGTLTLPSTEGKFPLIILVTGSGPQNRDEELFGHKPFWIIADYFARNGVAVYRYDDRGYAKSTGVFGEASSYDFMTDAMSAVKQLKKHPNIDKKRIGIAGHSEGGMIALIAAAKYPKDLAFIISLAGPGVNIIDLLLKQSEEINRASGLNETQIEIVRNFNYNFFNLALTEKEIKNITEKMSLLYNELTQDLSEDEKAELQINEAMISRTAIQLRSPWMQYFLAFNPSDYLKKIKIPVLAINGSLDIQVDADENLSAIERYLTEAKNKNFKIVKIENVNHVLQTSKTGVIRDYMLNKETVSPEILKQMHEFLKDKKIIQ